jgi:hypothetical protein
MGAPSAKDASMWRAWRIAKEKRANRLLWLAPRNILGYDLFRDTTRGRLIMEYGKYYTFICDTDTPGMAMRILPSTIHLMADIMHNVRAVSNGYSNVVMAIIDPTGEAAILTTLN